MHLQIIAHLNYIAITLGLLSSIIHTISMLPISLIRKATYLLLILLCITPFVSSAQETTPAPLFKAEVTSVISEDMQIIFDAEYKIQMLEARILSDGRKDEIITFTNDFQPMEVGQKFFVREDIIGDNESTYTVTHLDRSGALIFLLFIFIIAVISFGGWQGVRSLIALGVSFLAITSVLLPGILNGWNPLLASFFVAGTILFAAIFFTHGFNRESAVAYSGTMIAVGLAGIFAVFAVTITNLSGFAADEALTVNLDTGGTINFTALLLGAFIIGFLGVLDDIAVTQAAIVTELFKSNPQLSQTAVFKKAMRVGREHVGALVNTLVLAYTGASLPLLLYIRLTPTSWDILINIELFATEIVRVIVGSLGLILTVPLVTLLAVRYLKGYESKGGHTHHHH